jgi:hypothetical protein
VCIGSPVEHNDGTYQKECDGCCTENPQSEAKVPVTSLGPGKKQIQLADKFFISKFPDLLDRGPRGLEIDGL